MKAEKDDDKKHRKHHIKPERWTGKGFKPLGKHNGDKFWRHIPVYGHRRVDYIVHGMYSGGRQIAVEISTDKIGLDAFFLKQGGNVRI